MKRFVSKIWSLSFVVLIVLPVTAPFQTVSLADLLQARSEAGAALDSTRTRTSSLGDTAVSIDPPLDGTESRLKLESRSVNEMLKSFACRRIGFITRFTFETARLERAAPTILRL